MEDKIETAYLANELGSAHGLINEYLELAGVYRCNWNFGNAIHDANRTLGLMSLKNGNIGEAANYLLKAGKSPGSPQLNSFGPDLDLANELLIVGRVEEVRTYLNDINSFWERDDGRIDKWLARIESGEKPELNKLFYRALNTSPPWVRPSGGGKFGKRARTV